MTSCYKIHLPSYFLGWSCLSLSLSIYISIYLYIPMHVHRTKKKAFFFSLCPFVERMVSLLTSSGREKYLLCSCHSCGTSSWFHSILSTWYPKQPHFNCCFSWMMLPNLYITRWWFQIFFIFTPNLGKISILTHIFKWVGSTSN